MADTRINARVLIPKATQKSITDADIVGWNKAEPIDIGSPELRAEWERKLSGKGGKILSDHELALLKGKQYMESRKEPGYKPAYKPDYSNNGRQYNPYSREY